jgi:hypothetical protein
LAAAIVSSRSTSAWFAFRLSSEKRRDAGPDVGVGEGRALVDRAGEEPLAQRAVRDEPDPELRQCRQHLLLRPPPPQRVLALHRGYRLHGVGAADRAGRSLGQPEVPDLPGLDESLHRPGDVLDRYGPVDAVLVVQVDRVDSEPA